MGSIHIDKKNLFLALTPSIATWMAWLGLMLFFKISISKSRQFIMTGSIFNLPPYAREKNHLDAAGIESGTPAIHYSMPLWQLIS